MKVIFLFLQALGDFGAELKREEKNLKVEVWFLAMCVENLQCKKDEFKSADRSKLKDFIKFADQGDE